MKTYTFRVALEPDGEGWHIYVPEWEIIGASTWGYTKEGALYYIKEVLEMIIEEFEEEGRPLPGIAEGHKAAMGDGQWVTVTR